MTKLPFGGQVPAHSTSLDEGVSLDDGAMLSEWSIVAKLRANLQYTIGAVFGRWSSTFAPGDEEPIRSELFSIERLEQHAESLAATQRATTKPTTDRRLEMRLRANQRALRTAYQATVVAVREERAITPAADWLVNNFHIVEEQVREIRIDLPPGFHRILPKLIDGPLAGYPRVFGLAWAFVAHTDSCFDPKMLCRFVRAYQRVQPLTIGELWAVAITLRVVLVENLRRLAGAIASYQAARKEANVLADRLLGIGSREAEPPDTVLQPVDGPLSTAFAVQLIQRLREQDPRVLPALLWLDERLAAQGTTADEIVHSEQQLLGAANVTIGNVITSMRLMSAIDWRALFESVSLVDETLRSDSNFAALDFATRDLYRHAIEELARGSRRSEIEVTRLALRAAKDAPELAPGENNTASDRKRDPGYYLIAKGRPAFEGTLGYRVKFRGWLVRANTTVGISGYLGAVTIATAVVVALMLSWITVPGGIVAFGVLTLLALIPASDAAVALVNCGATSRFDASSLPGLGLAEGVPADLRTMIVIPTLLTTPITIAGQIERLEVHHLANADGYISFALLSDWTDSPTESVPGDDALLAAAADGIAVLNRRYGPGPDGDRFLLLHRRRLWNSGQRAYIGWERKRGKLHELNRLLRGATDTSFASVGGRAPVVPGGVRYVIVLDADTRLPRGAAKRLIGKMAHPLNRPTLDPHACRVIDGYAIMQPRVTPSMPTGGEGSLFQRVFSNTNGMDPYACAVSDVYQDLFGEGSYCGKGIYDVDLFEAALAGRIPENTLLSHDLLEGIFARAGLVTDIEVIDEFPARYDVAVSRQYRWARGDWQLLPWILGRAQVPNGRRSRAIPTVGRWKMIDNLRRSLSAPATFLALVGGWALPFDSAALWSVFIVGTVSVPAVLPLVTGILPRRLGLSARIHLRAVGADIKLALSQIALLVAFLPHQAWAMAEAIVRTLYRLVVSRRNLLEWVTAAQAKVSPRLDVLGFYRKMAGGIALAAGAAAFVGWATPDAWLVAAPFIMLWLVSPAVARWVSLPLESALPPVSAADTRSLRLIARRTWHFFETFVTAGDHMLPPDNFQEDPAPVVAHRTSPTNIGLYLLSVAAAQDFGWLGLLDSTERLEATFQTMARLERFRGHFYNWYDTSDLNPLEPQYISSVDSGNLAGHLITLNNVVGEMTRRPILDSRWRVGIGDAVDLLRETLNGVADDAGLARKPLDEAIDNLAASLRLAPPTPVGIAAQLKELASKARTVADRARSLRSDSGAETLDWADTICAAVQGYQRDLDELMPWAGLIAGEAAMDSGLRSVATMPTLTALTGLCENSISELTSNHAATSGTAALIDTFRQSALAAASLAARLAALGEHVRTLVDAMEFGFLFDPERELLSIGYRVSDGRLDPSYYDLLASEARLASFVAIAKGDLPTRHWFRLGRPLAPVGYRASLISWSGSMFEYLMPCRR